MTFDKYLISNPIILAIKDERKENTSNLYHYTSIDGLEGIISTQKIRATHISYLNDTREYIEIFLKSAKIVVNNEQNQRYQKYNNIFSPLLDHVEQWIDGDPFATQYNDVYVCSFTEKRDDLSQWRGYASNGGYQIGFSLIHLEETARTNGNLFWLFPCVYDECSKMQIIEGLFSKAIEKFENKISTVEQIQKWLIDELRFMAPMFKDDNFKDEREWRLFAEKHWDYDKREFRKKDGIFIPYIDIALSVDNKIHLTEIIIGPDINSQHAMYSLSSFVRKKVHEGILSMENGLIDHSKVPYRPKL